MSALRLRLRRIRFKAGGSVEMLPPPSRSEGQATLLRHAGIIQSDMPDMAGFAIVAWDASGGRMEGAWFDPKRSPIGETLIPAVVHDVLMRRFCDPRED